MDDDEIRALVTRLARPNASGGEVIERAALLAEGADFAAVVRWITAHGGIPETASTISKPGLHPSRHTNSGGAGPQTALRYVLPPGALA